MFNNNRRKYKRNRKRNRRQYESSDDYENYDNVGNLDDFAESGDEYSFTRRPMLKKRRQQALSPNFNTHNEGFFGVSEFDRLGGSDSLNNDTVSSRYYHRNRTSTKEHAFANCRSDYSSAPRISKAAKMQQNKDFMQEWKTHIVAVPDRNTLCPAINCTKCTEFEKNQKLYKEILIQLRRKGKNSHYGSTNTPPIPQFIPHSVCFKCDPNGYAFQGSQPSKQKRHVVSVHLKKQKNRLKDFRDKLQQTQENSDPHCNSRNYREMQVHKREIINIFSESEEETQKEAKFTANRECNSATIGTPTSTSTNSTSMKRSINMTQKLSNMDPGISLSVEPDSTNNILITSDDNNNDYNSNNHNHNKNVIDENADDDEILTNHFSNNDNTNFVDIDTCSTNDIENGKFAIQSAAEFNDFESMNDNGTMEESVHPLSFNDDDGSFNELNTNTPKQIHINNITNNNRTTTNRVSFAETSPSHTPPTSIAGRPHSPSTNVNAITESSFIKYWKSSGKPANKLINDAYSVQFHLFCEKVLQHKLGFRIVSVKFKKAQRRISLVSRTENQKQALQSIEDYDENDLIFVQIGIHQNQWVSINTKHASQAIQSAITQFIYTNSLMFIANQRMFAALKTQSKGIFLFKNDKIDMKLLGYVLLYELKKFNIDIYSKMQCNVQQTSQINSKMNRLKKQHPLCYVNLVHNFCDRILSSISHIEHIVFESPIYQQRVKVANKHPSTKFISTKSRRLKKNSDNKNLTLSNLSSSEQDIDSNDNEPTISEYQCDSSAVYTDNLDVDDKSSAEFSNVFYLLYLYCNELIFSRNRDHSKPSQVFIPMDGDDLIKSSSTKYSEVKPQRKTRARKQKKTDPVKDSLNKPSIPQAKNQSNSINVSPTAKKIKVISIYDLNKNPDEFKKKFQFMFKERISGQLSIKTISVIQSKRMITSTIKMLHYVNLEQLLSKYNIINNKKLTIDTIEKEELLYALNTMVNICYKCHFYVIKDGNCFNCNKK